MKKIPQGLSAPVPGLIETSWPHKAKFHVEPLSEGRKKVYINGPGNMTNMAAGPIYGKNLQNLLLQTNSPMIKKLGMEHYVLNLRQFYTFYINDDHELNLTPFKTMSNLAKLVFLYL